MTFDYVDIEISNKKIEERENAILFLLHQIENIVTDGNDFNFDEARPILEQVGIDIDLYFQG